MREQTKAPDNGAQATRKRLRVTAEEAALLCKRDPRYAPLVEHFGLLERELFSDVYAGLVLTVMGQQLSDQVVRKLTQSLEPKLLQSPQALLSECTRCLAIVEGLPPKTPRATLAEEGVLPFSVSKLKTLQRLAESFVTGELSVAMLQAMSSEAREERLLSIKGIGPWSVSMIELMVFGAMDYLPIHDYGVQQGWAYLSGTDIKTLTPKERLQKLSNHAREVSPVGSAATLYLWALKGVKGKLNGD